MRFDDSPTTAIVLLVSRSLRISSPFRCSVFIFSICELGGATEAVVGVCAQPASQTQPSSPPSLPAPPAPRFLLATRGDTAPTEAHPVRCFQLRRVAACQRDVPRQSATDETRLYSHRSSSRATSLRACPSRAPISRGRAARRRELPPRSARRQSCRDIPASIRARALCDSPVRRHSSEASGPKRDTQAFQREKHALAARAENPRLFYGSRGPVASTQLHRAY